MLLLDTHVLVRCVHGGRSVGAHAQAAIDRALTRDALFASALSYWEIAMLVEAQRIKLGTSESAFRTKVRDRGIRELDVDSEIAIAAGELPRSHADPADRMLVASAMSRDLTLVTADAKLLEWRMHGYAAQDATA